MSSQIVSRLTLLVCMFSLFVGVARAQDSKLTVLLRESPRRPNAMAYLHVPSMAKLLQDANVPSRLNEQLEELWLISDLNAATLRPTWEAGYAVVKNEMDASSLAKTTGGYADEVGGKQVVWTPKQSYIVPLGGDRIGFLRPADRRLIGAWFSDKGNAQLSGYLTENAVQSEKYLSFMIAMDLENVFSAVPMAEKLKTFDSLGTSDTRALAKLLASIRGMSIIIGRQSLSECIASFEFAESPEPIQPIAVKLLTELLNRNGTAVPEVAQWKPAVKGNTLSFRGSIGEDTFENLLGIFSLEQQAGQVVDSKSSDSSPGDAGNGPTARASKTYYDGVQKHIEKVRNHSAQTAGYRAKWNDQEARKIDEIGTLHVDPELVTYGQDVANLLRENALTIRTGNIEAGAKKAEQSLIHRGYYGDGYYGSSYYDPNTSSDYQRVTSAKARAAAASDFTATLKMIDEMSSVMRKSMTSRYNVQF